ncbi:MAG: hypothetical protein ABSF57_05460 [Acidobacteriaceae bacterium]
MKQISEAQDSAQEPAPSPQADVGWRSVLNRWAPIGVTACMIVGVAKTVAEPLLRPVQWMTYEEDDFFYYLKIAQNLAHGHGSTFNGIVPTNGYHPLWLMALTILSFFTGNPKLIHLFLAVTTYAATLATYFLSRALIRISGAGDLIANALAVYVALYSIHIFTGGMEVVLTVPLVLAVLLAAQHRSFWQKGLWQSACLGVLVSAMALSRLDTVLLAGLMLLSVLVHPALRRSVRASNAAGLAVGLTPLALYFLSNRIWFDTWLPVSGMAKQMKFNHAPSAPAIMSLLGKQHSQLLSVVPVVVAILLLPAMYKRLTEMQKALYPVALIFPFFYLLLLSCLSDWKLWDWYFYSLRTALCVALAMFCVWRPTARVLAWPLVGAVASVGMAALIFRTHASTGAQFQLYEIAQDVRDFAATHPGRYAMGDRSGMVAYLLPQPMVQTEGLVMDRHFLSEIQRQLPLREVLGEYGVRYYIATAYPPYSAGCFHAVEPAQAGPSSPRMRGDFCEAPVAVFQQRDVRTMVFDLDAAPSTGAP